MVKHQKGSVGLYIIMNNYEKNKQGRILNENLELNEHHELI